MEQPGYFDEDFVSDLFGQMAQPSYFDEGFADAQEPSGSGQAAAQGQTQASGGKQKQTKTKAQQLLSSAIKTNKDNTKRVTKSEVRSMLSSGVSAKEINKALKSKGSGYLGSKASKFLSKSLAAQKAGKPVPTGQPKARTKAKEQVKPSKTKQQAAVVSKYKTQTAGRTPKKAAPVQRQAPARQAPARQAPARQAPARQAPARQAPARQAPARQAPAQNRGPSKSSGKKKK
jgi:hypothetical protein